MYIASAQGMVILLYVVEERVMVMKREIKQVSEIDFLTDVHVTMQILWGVERHLIMRRTVLLHSPCLRIGRKHVIQLVVKNLC